MKTAAIFLAQDATVSAPKAETSSTTTVAGTESKAPENTASAAPAQQSMGQSIMSFLPFILIVVVMFFLMYRGQKKEQKRRQELISSIKVGDKVVTIGGMHGVVAEVKDDHFTLKVAENVKIDFAKSAVASAADKGANAGEVVKK